MLDIKLTNLNVILSSDGKTGNFVLMSPIGI